jgi:hypothetical protein
MGTARGQRFSAIGKVVLLGVAVRAGWALLVPVRPLSDSNAYDTLARNLALGNGYCWEPGQLTAYWPVGTSFLYSVLYRLFGFTYTPIVILNIFLSAAVIALTMALAGRWFGPAVARAAGLLLALWPSQIQFTTVLASELPFVLVLLAALWVWGGECSRVRGRGVLAGALLAGASYIRPTALLLPAVFAVLRPPGRSFFQRLLGLAGMVAPMAVLIVPWAVRNWQVFGRPVLISTNGGANTWMGNNPVTTGGYMAVPEAAPGVNEADRDRQLRDAAVRYIAQHPGRFLVRTLTKLVVLHDRETIGVAWNLEGLRSRFSPAMVATLKVVSTVFWWGVLAAAGVGVAVLLRRQGWLALCHPVLILWAYFAVLHAVTVIQDRYHFPSVPFVAVLAALPLSRLGGGTRATPAAAGGVISSWLRFRIMSWWYGSGWRLCYS